MLNAKKLAVVLALLGVMAFPQTSQAAGQYDGGEMLASEPMLGPTLRPPQIPGAVLKANLAYGQHELQKLDVYIPANASARRPAPIMVMVHGGGWRRGDKAADGVVINKGTNFIKQGYIFVTVNYRLTPEVNVMNEAEDVASAIAYVQKNAASWKGDASKIVTLGHSAGAHLVTLLAADQSIGRREGAKPWLGSVALDSGAMNVPELMTSRHPPLYDDAFGKDPRFWRSVSPYHQLNSRSLPVMAVCSTQRKDDPCAQAASLAERAKSVGAPTLKVEKQDLSHGEVNSQLGLPGQYTKAVDRFIKGLLN